MDLDQFDELALKIIPIGTRSNSVLFLRKEIARVLRETVSSTIEIFRNQHLPIEIAESKRKLEGDLLKFETERSEFKKVVEGHIRFLKAVEKWIEWCEGKDSMEVHHELWTNVKETWEQYKLLRTK